MQQIKVFATREGNETLLRFLELENGPEVKEFITYLTEARRNIDFVNDTYNAGFKLSRLEFEVDGLICEIKEQ